MATRKANNKILEGQAVVVVDGHNNKVSMGTASYCERCGTLCGINFVGLVFPEGTELPHVGGGLKLDSRPWMPVIAGPLPELGVTDDGDYDCDDCRE